MYKKILTLLLIIAIGILGWAPWMSKNESEDAIFKVAITANDKEECQEKPWSATWAPFGRYVHHCDKKWYLGFWELL